MKAVAFICNDTLGKQMAGPAIRCLELAQQLSAEFEVALVGRGHLPEGHWDFKLIAPSKQSIKKIADQYDVIVVQGDIFGVYPFLRHCRAVVIADMYCPLPLEFHQSGYALSSPVRLSIGGSVAHATSAQLKFADGFICASERQRDLWVGAMMTLGRLNALQYPDSKNTTINDLLALVPFGFPSETPDAKQGVLRQKFGISDDALVLLWGGGLYEWFDPLSIITAVAELSKEGLDVHLVFMGVKHPNDNISDHDMAGKAVELARALSVFDTHVHFNFGWVDYADRVNFLADADVGVCAHFDTPETRYSFRTRILDYLWTGLPMILTKGDFFAQEVEQHQLGRTVDYQNANEWAQAIREVYESRDLLAAHRMNVQGYRSQYQWREVAKPLISLCHRIEKAKDVKYMKSLFGGAMKVKTPSLVTRVRGSYERGGFKEMIKSVRRKLKLL